MNHLSPKPLKITLGSFQIFFLFDTTLSLTPVANNGSKSDCLHLKMNYCKEKMYLYDKYIIQRCPNKVLKTFLIEDFFLFATGVNDTSVAP
jgi:hypothetical protein